MRKKLSAVFLIAFFCFPLFIQNNAYAADNYHLQFNSVTMYTGESVHIWLYTSSGKPVQKKCKWTSNDKKAFDKETFDEETSELWFSPHKKGTYTITCTCAGKKYSCKVRVKSFLKKSDKKVLYQYTNKDGEVVQLVRVKNHTSSTKSISNWETTWDAIKSGKYAYLTLNKSFGNTIDIIRPNVKIKGNTNIAPTRNLSSKIKVSATPADDGNCNFKVKNTSSEYLDVDITFAMLDQDGKVFYIGSASSSVDPKKSDEFKSIINGEGKGATKVIAYWNAATY